MNVRVREILPPAKPHRLADASVELIDDSGDLIIVSDIRVLENRQGQIWVAMPSRSIKTDGRTFEYQPQVEPSRQLQRKIEDAVIDAFNIWKRRGASSEAQNA